jgi:hypothetical protein
MGNGINRTSPKKATNPQLAMQELGSQLRAREQCIFSCACCCEPDRSQGSSPLAGTTTLGRCLAPRVILLALSSFPRPVLSSRLAWRVFVQSPWPMPQFGGRRSLLSTIRLWSPPILLVFCNQKFTLVHAHHFIFAILYS